MVPVIVPRAAREAKAVPCSSARNKTTGAEVRGSPTSQPLTREPQRRPMRVIMRMKRGVRRSFRSSMG